MGCVCIPRKNVSNQFFELLSQLRKVPVYTYLPEINSGSGYNFLNTGDEPEGLGGEEMGEEGELDGRSGQWRTRGD